MPGSSDTAVSWSTRVAQWIAVVGAYKAYDYAFDYAPYRFVIFRLVLGWGGTVMATLSMLSCLLGLYAYDRLGRDWLGIEFAKSLHLDDGTSRWRRWLARLLRRSNGLAFELISIRFDPFVTTAYLRRGSYNGLSRRDWRNLFGSVVLCDAAWPVVCFGGIGALKRML